MSNFYALPIHYKDERGSWVPVRPGVSTSRSLCGVVWPGQPLRLGMRRHVTCDKCLDLLAQLDAGYRTVRETVLGRSDRVDINPKM